MSDGDDRSSKGDTVADLLEDPIRRGVVERLYHRDGIGLRYLALVITREVAERRGTSIIDVGVGRIQEELERSHIPALAEAGLVRYNERTEWLELDESWAAALAAELEVED